ncbi:MAG: hypothetical protein P8M80_02750 [Pirellulaceae bacterium]|jgi:hypothetical protein|nr:hypothetical protein [Pirellulaceae bacterium]
MNAMPLFRVVQKLRQSLKQMQTLGGLESEKFLIVAGDYVGHQFCFERGEASWLFEESFLEVQIAQRTSRMELKSLVDPEFAASTYLFQQKAA